MAVKVALPAPCAVERLRTDMTSHDGSVLIERRQTAGNLAPELIDIDAGVAVRDAVPQSRGLGHPRGEVLEHDPTIGHGVPIRATRTRKRSSA